MASEVQVLVMGFDEAYEILHLIEQIVRQAVQLEAYINMKIKMNGVCRSTLTH